MSDYKSNPFKHACHSQTATMFTIGIATVEGHHLTTKAFLLLAEKYSYYTGFNINNYFEIDDIGYSLLHLAVAGMIYCNLNLLPSQRFFQSANSNDHEINICKYQHLKIIQLLFEHGIDVNIEDNVGITAFHILLMYMPEYEFELCCSFLPFIKHPNINLNSQTIFGTTILNDCLSVERPMVLSTKLLVEYGADMFIPDNHMHGIALVDTIDSIVSNRRTINC